MNTRLKNRFNVSVFKKTKNGHYYRYDRELSYFKLSVSLSLVKFKNLSHEKQLIYEKAI